MEEITCKQVATLTGGKWDKVIDKNRRVYSTETISPTLTTCGGGQSGDKNYDRTKNYSAGARI